MRSLFSVLLPLLLCASAMGGPFYNRINPYCSEVTPGVQKMFRGVDITTLDMLPLEIVGDNGYKSPVIKMRCTKPRSWFRGENQYDIPDQVWTMTTTPGGLLSTDVELYQNSYDVRKSLAKTVGKTKKTSEFFFAGANTLIHMQQEIMNSSMYYFDTSAIDSVRRVDLLPHWALELDDYAQDYLKNVIGDAPYTSNPEAYHGFVEQFGTHYFAAARFGGRIRVLQQTRSAYFETHTKEEALSRAWTNYERAVKNIKSDTVATRNEEEDGDAEFAAMTTQIVTYYGGSTNLLTSNGTRVWQPTVDTDPWLLSGQIRLISDLIRDDVQREGIKRATWQHILRRYLDELYRRCMAGKCYRGPSPGSLTSRIRALYATTLGGLVEAEVAALKDEIERD